MSKKLTPSEIEFQSFTDIIIGEAVMNIASGRPPHEEIKNVIVQVLKWLHSKEEFRDVQ